MTYWAFIIYSEKLIICLYPNLVIDDKNKKKDEETVLNKIY